MVEGFVNGEEVRTTEPTNKTKTNEEKEFARNDNVKAKRNSCPGQSSAGSLGSTISTPLPVSPPGRGHPLCEFAYPNMDP